MTHDLPSVPARRSSTGSAKATTSADVAISAIIAPSSSLNCSEKARPLFSFHSSSGAQCNTSSVQWRLAALLYLGRGAAPILPAKGFDCGNGNVEEAE